jgi:hypothetical protein
MNFSTSDESLNMKTPEVGHSDPPVRAGLAGKLPAGDCPAVSLVFPGCYGDLYTLGK